MSRKWLEDCANSHHGYRTPSRLISVAEKDNVEKGRLILTKILRANEPWVALSYCWSGPQPIQTTKRSIQAHRSSISIDSLPATLRDAVHVAGKLGQRYLQIDCLYIVQDDEHDKAQEISKMPAIYGGATLTIVAASAESCTNGFLHDRAVYEPGMAIPTLLSESQKSVAELVSIRHMEIGSEPVDTRGWTYQERILSKRIMSFGTSEITYSCLTKTKTERSFNSGDEGSLGIKSRANFPENDSILHIYEKWIMLKCSKNK
jgi:hypothetical protein